MKIVSLLPSTTEICFALGLGDQLAAVTHECDFPKAAQAKPSITRNALPAGLHDSQTIDRLISELLLAGESIYQIDLPLLHSIAPDLILTQELCQVCAVSYDDVIAIARALPGEPEVVSIEPRSVDEIIDSIGTVGRLTGQEAVAGSVMRSLRQRIDAIGESVSVQPDREPARVVCLEWLDPPMVGGHWVPEMVELAGGRDMLGKPGQPSYRVEWERVREAQPDVIVLMPCGYHLDETLAEVEQLARQERFPGWLSELPAVQAGHVYAVDGSSYFNRPGPRIVDGIAMLAAIIQPNLPSELVPEGGYAPARLLAASGQSGG